MDTKNHPLVLGIDGIEMIGKNHFKNMNESHVFSKEICFLNTECGFIPKHQRCHVFFVLMGLGHAVSANVSADISKEKALNSGS